jgi:5'-nucleotidase
MNTRRQFIKQVGIGGFILQLGKFPMHAFMDDVNTTKITILHTNDVHSRIDPFPEDGTKNAGLGGAAKRAALIKKIRSQSENTLLFDCGDIFQGTPYFNYYGGELEMKLMTEMKYDAATMGNHDFDNGIEGFEKQLAYASFPILVANYNFDNTIMKDKTQAYKIFKKDGVKIGVFGLGIQLDGLVTKSLYKETEYIDPLTTAEKIASQLKNDEKCDYVICLSHLGYKYDNAKVSDIVLAQYTSSIDMVLGGHTHTFLKEPTIIKNKAEKEVIINQCGWGGMVLGQIDLYFEKNKPGKCVTCQNLTIK